MIAWENILSQEIVQRLGWTLLHFVWQAAAVALLLAILLRVSRKTSANLRYIIACSALALIVLLPVITIQLVPASAAYIEPVSAPPVLPKETANELSMAEKPMLEKPARLERLATATWKQWSSDLLEPALPYIVSGWLVGVLGLSVWHLGGWAQLQRLRRKMVKQVNESLHSKLKELAEKLGVNRAVQLMESAVVQVPTVIGWLSPVILLPASALTGLTTEQLEAMLAHELAHIRRFDYLVNMLQTVVEILGFYHPAVWWISHKIRAERENCCDDLAVSISGDRVRYAKALTSMEEIRASQAELAVAATGGSLLARIRRLVGKESTSYSRDGWIPSAIAILLIVAMIIPTTLALTSSATTKPMAEREAKPTKTLHEAAADGDLEQVKLLISKGASMNAKGRMGRTALHRAAEKGHADVVELLIDRGADIKAKGRRQETPLHSAASSGDRKTIELLLNKGADISAKNTRGATPLFVAMTSAEEGRKEVVELLVSKGAKVPAFHRAAYMGDMEKLKKCLQDGIDINSQEDFGTTALHLAANSGKKDIVEFLISKGAQVDAKDTFGLMPLTPLYHAAAHNYEDIVDLLLAKGADVNGKKARDERGYTLLHHATLTVNKDAVKLLINKGADVNAQDQHGYTPLIYAIWVDDKGMVELLISKGADINTEDKNGYTPMHWAALMDSNDLVELLTAEGAKVASTIHLAAGVGDLAKVKTFIEEGTDVNAKDKMGLTPLTWAVIRDQRDIAEFLIAKGADVNAEGIKGQTPLHNAASLGHREVIELLITKGADVDAKNQNGRTPLDVATLRGYKEVVELLLAKGADINTKNRWGNTPLHIAAKQGHRQVVQLLLDKGADVNAKSKNGQTPLDVAEKTGYKGIFELLRKHGAKE